MSTKDRENMNRIDNRNDEQLQRIELMEQAVFNKAGSSTGGKTIFDEMTEKIIHMEIYLKKSH